MFLSEWREFPSAPCLAKKKKLDDSSRLYVVENAHVPDMLPSLFPSWSGKGLNSIPVTLLKNPKRLQDLNRMHVPCGQRAEFLNVKLGGAYCNHWAI